MQGKKQKRVSRSTAPTEFSIDGIRVILTRKAIKNLYLRVKPPDGHLEISAPLRMRISTIENFVNTRWPWINEMRQRVQASATVQELDGEALPTEKWTEEHRRAAAAKINARLETLLPRWTAVVGKQPSAITLRAMKTRWGSCTPKTGRIRLNLELADIPDHFLEYVLVHELTHLRASGHGPEFQRLMTQYLPDWRNIRRDLNTYVIF